MDKHEFLKTIKWCTDNKIRFEVVMKPKDKNTLALFYVFHNYYVKFIKLSEFLDCFPFAEKIDFRHFVVLPKPKILLMINESKSEIFSIPLLATEP